MQTSIGATILVLFGVQLTSVTIIMYAGGMVSWNIYYNNLHRRSSAKTSRSLRTRTCIQDVTHNAMPNILAIKWWWVCNELKCAFQTYLISVPFVVERHHITCTCAALFSNNRTTTFIFWIMLEIHVILMWSSRSLRMELVASVDWAQWRKKKINIYMNKPRALCGYTHHKHI